MAERANITPQILEWARETAKMSIELAAKKISVKPEKIIEWENGKSKPTIRQAEVLAKLYRRPFAILFLPEIPSDFQPLQDFRSKGSKPLKTASVFIIREIQQKQAWISSLFQEDKEPPLPFVGKYSIQDNPVIIGEDILNTLKINPSSYAKKEPIKEWIEAAEAVGIFISRTSFVHTRLKIALEELQGFAIADSYAPYVFINSKDWSAPQLFTLVHELAHIWIAKSGISNDIVPDLLEEKHFTKDKFHPVELICNEIAANALMPESIMSDIKSVIFNTYSEILKESKKLGVSVLSFVIRAFNLKMISADKFQEIKIKAEKEFQDFLYRKEEKDKKQQKGGPNPYLLKINKNGKLFTQIVLDSYRGGRITPTEASGLLNAKVNKFYEFEIFLYR